MNKNKLIIFSFFIAVSSLVNAENFHETLIGAVGGGNYSYYRLTQPGTVILQLNSLQGDADLYISSGNIKPTFDIENHEFQSTTCGAEQVRVPSNYERPLYIAVYGHPSHEMSLYELKIDVHESSTTDEENDFLDVDYEEDKSSISKPTFTPDTSDKDNSDSESFFWPMLINILQVAFEVLFE